MSGHSDPPDTPAPRPTAAAGKAKPTNASRREDRLKAALKANMARRKAQARAKAGVTVASSDNEQE